MFVWVEWEVGGGELGIKCTMYNVHTDYIEIYSEMCNKTSKAQPHVSSTFATLKEISPLWFDIGSRPGMNERIVGQIYRDIFFFYIICYIRIIQIMHVAHNISSNNNNNNNCKII